MRRNVAGQIIGIQMTGNDGSAFTGAVTVYVAVDGGTQAVGSVGGGACTHKGNGYHVYAPAQAETDGEHVAFTFVGAGAITATAQVYTGVDVIAISGSTAAADAVEDNIAHLDSDVSDALQAADYTSPDNDSISDLLDVLADVDGDTVPELLAKLSAFISAVGERTVTDNGDGTRTIAFKNSGGTTVLEWTVNATGEVVTA